MGPLVGGWQGGVAGGWRGCSDLWGQGLQGILYCMMTERGIRWVRYDSVFWSRLSEVNSQWPWGLSWEESGGGGWERVSRGQGWLGGLLGWFLIAAERFGLPAPRQMLTQEIRGLSFLFSQELLLHTASFFHFCRSIWHFTMHKRLFSFFFFTELTYAVSWEKISFYRLKFHLCQAILQQYLWSC